MVASGLEQVGNQNEMFVRFVSRLLAVLLFVQLVKAVKFDVGVFNASLFSPEVFFVSDYSPPNQMMVDN